MRLRWILLPLGVLAVGAAVAYYLFWVPPQLADDYEEKAEPEHAKIGQTLSQVTGEFNNVVLGTIAFKRKDARAYMRTYLRVAARDMREQRRALRRVRRARRELARIDESALTEPPDWPLLGSRGDMEDAQALAGKERDYLRKARAFLRDFAALLAYEVRADRWIGRHNLSFARAETRIPKVATSPGQITGPLDAAALRAELAVRGYRRLKPPKPMRAEHRRVAREMQRDIRDQRAISRAVKRNDFTRVRAIERRVKRDLKRRNRASRAALAWLVDRSRYARQIEDLKRRETKGYEAFEDL
ncbi:MAG TPA: hypothetical protein VF715_15480 [Thermoleophilaceae bacterium]